MKISRIDYAGRKAWQLDNGTLQVVVLQGGGHIAALRLAERPEINPLWEPVWPSKEPWEYRKEDATYYESRLLASIRGHNLCLPWFGGASAGEEHAGLGPHGEAPVMRWRLLSESVSTRRLTAVFGCDLPVSNLRVARTITLDAGESCARVREQVVNLSRRDVPYTYCEHVTVGAPFLEKGVTVFDMPALEGHTFPYDFEPCPRLKSNSAFSWPMAPGAGSEQVDLRMIARRYRKSSDFSTQHLDPAREWGWFSALNQDMGLMLAYIWKRADFPWVGNWEENYGRKRSPWAGKTLTRGMEFANTPFPSGLRDAVERGSMHGEPTFRWLPARGKISVEYGIVWQALPEGVRGVKDARPAGRGFEFEYV